MDKEQLASIAMDQGVPAALDLMTASEWDGVKAEFVRAVAVRWGYQLAEIESPHHAAFLDSLRTGYIGASRAVHSVYNNWIDGWGAAGVRQRVDDETHQLILRLAATAAMGSGEIDHWQRRELHDILTLGPREIGEDDDA